jgi:hypothetical protein
MKGVLRVSVDFFYNKRYNAWTILGEMEECGLFPLLPCKVSHRMEGVYMKRRVFIFFLSALTLTNLSGAQEKYRRGIFLHHSTGSAIWGPNGSATSVPIEMHNYNVAHGYTGADSIDMTQEWFPNNYAWHGNDIEWRFLYDIFIGNGVGADTIPYAANRIIFVKVGHVATRDSSEGQPSDTLQDIPRSYYVYKWYWRKILDVMKQHPDNFFVIWTANPFCSGSDVPSSQALRTLRFCQWAKDTLSKGLDSSYPYFPRNVYVFDFYRKICDTTTGYLKAEYGEGCPNDSHPNAAATELVAPLFVSEIFDAAIAYEDPASVRENTRSLPSSLGLEQNYPNPFNPSTMIGFTLPYSGNVRLIVYNVLGETVSTIINKHLSTGYFKVEWNPGNMPAGVYFYQLRLNPDAIGTSPSSPLSQTKKLLILK